MKMGIPATTVAIAAREISRRNRNRTTRYRPVPTMTTGSTVAFAPDAPTISRAISAHEPRSRGLRQVSARTRSTSRYTNARKNINPKANVQLSQRWMKTLSPKGVFVDEVRSRGPSRKMTTTAVTPVHHDRLRSRPTARS